MTKQEQINTLVNVYTNLGHTHFTTTENAKFTKEKVELVKLTISKLKSLVENI